MSRLTQRVTAVWTTVKCPRCGAQIDPDTLTTAELAANIPEQPEGKRWSFVWTPPRGDFCPDCDFPMSKYFGRLKWIRTLSVGVAAIILFVTLQIIGSMARFGEAYTVTMQVLVLAAGAVALVGMAGVIVGGKHKTVRASDFSKPG